MKRIIKFSIFVISLSFSSCSSEPPFLCECLTTKGDLPSGCDQVFKNRYGTTEPSTSQMKDDYYDCKSK